MLSQYMKAKIRKALNIYKDEDVVAEKLGISYALVASVSITPKRLRRSPAIASTSLKKLVSLEHFLSLKIEFPKLMAASLTKREEDIIRLRFYDSKTYEGIGAYYSHSKAWAYTEVQSALAKLKKAVLNTQPTLPA